MFKAILLITVTQRPTKCILLLTSEDDKSDASSQPISHSERSLKINRSFSNKSFGESVYRGAGCSSHEINNINRQDFLYEFSR